MASISSKSVPIDDINELLRCSMCSGTLREPRILDCFHNFCKVCLGKYVERLRGGDKKMDTFPCPTCRSEFTLKSNQDVAELPSSHFINNMLEIIAIQQKATISTTCSRCQDPAINHCASCEMFMCKKCSESHNFWLKNHSVLGVQELGNPVNEVKMRGKLYCLKHKDEVLKYYCETCKELSCIDCVVINHQKSDHSCVAVSELADKQRKTLQSSCTTLDEKLAEGKEALNNICEVMSCLEKNAKTAKNQIKEQKENILKIVAEKLDESATKMEEEVNEVYSELHRDLSEQHDEVVEKLGHVEGSVSSRIKLKKSSSILKGEVAFIKQLEKWLGEKCKWNLCYRASRDGWSFEDFHKHCDNKGPTVVLVKANDCIFGGYTDQHWDSSGGWKHFNSSFLFSLRNKDNLAPFIAYIKQGLEHYAVYGDTSYGPTFGGGHDLYIHSNPQVNQSHSSFGYTYQLPPGYVYGSKQSDSLLAGQFQFLPSEIEVFN